MPYKLQAMDDSHREAVTGIINHHIASGFAAYPSHAMGDEFFRFTRGQSPDHPAYVVADGPEVVGFGLLRKHLPPDTLARTAEVSYFFLPGHTGQGLGSRLLELLTQDGRQMGIDNLLANVSSLNEGSLRFHRRHGFTEVGRFARVGHKWGQDFDIIWLQKFI